MAHDDELCPSGAGPAHYRDECDEESEAFTDPEPEPVESTCAWLMATEDYAEEQGKAKVKERGLMVGWRDANAQESVSPRGGLPAAVSFTNQALDPSTAS